MSTPDQRQQHKIHYPHETLWILILFALASGQTNILAISRWIHHHHEFLLDKIGIRTRHHQAKLPSQATIYRFFWQAEQHIEILETRARQWALAVTRGADLDVIHASVDGKVPRGSKRARAG